MAVGHVVEIEQPRLLGHAGVKDRLEQQIAQLALQLGPILPLDRVGDLVGFLDRVGGDGGEALFHVPWAAGDRVAQGAP